MIRQHQNNLGEPAQLVVAVDLRLWGSSDCCLLQGAVLRWALLWVSSVLHCNPCSPQSLSRHQSSTRPKNETKALGAVCQLTIKS